MIASAEDRSRRASYTRDPIAMAATQSPTTQHVPAWKRLGLKLKNSQAEAVEPNAPVPQRVAPDIKSTKRKAADITADVKVSHDHAKSGSEGINESTPKRRKSVAFADNAKIGDGDSNEK